MVVLTVVVHIFESKTVAVYAPEAKLDVVAGVVSPLLHMYVYGETPPVGVTVASPSLKPLQLISAPLKLDVTCAAATTIGGSVRDTLSLAEHIFTSHTVAV
jgi:hypothetical protein